MTSFGQVAEASAPWTHWRACLANMTAAALLMAGGTAQSACELKQLTIPVRIANSRVVSEVTLNGAKVPMMIDSGAFYSSLVESAASELGLKLRALPRGMSVIGHTGFVQASRTRVDSVNFNGVALKDLEFLVGGNEPGFGLKGLLGRNFLGSTDVEYDLANGFVRLFMPSDDCKDTNLAYWAGEAPVVMVPLLPSPRDKRPAAAVGVRLNGKEFRAMLDTGAPETSVALQSALKAGLAQHQLRRAGITGGLGMRMVARYKWTFGEFELGSERISRNELAVDDVAPSDHDMILGLDYFLSHRIYISKLQQKLYATWNGGPVFEREAFTPADAQSREYASPPSPVSPDDSEGLARLAAIAEARGDFTTGLMHLDQAIERTPDDAMFRLARARAHHRLNNTTKAIQDLDEALRIESSLPEARLLRAFLRESQRNQPGALDDLRQLDTLLPSSSPLRMLMAELYDELGMTLEAIRQWDLWMPTHMSDVNLPRALSSRCWLRARLGLQMGATLAECAKAVDYAKSSELARRRLGWAYLRMGNVEAATSTFNKAIELDSESAWSLYGRALARKRQGLNSLAAEDLASALRLEPRQRQMVQQAGFEFDDLPLSDAVETTGH